MRDYIDLKFDLEDIPGILKVGQEVRYRRRNGAVSVWMGDVPIDRLTVGSARAILERPKAAISVITRCGDGRVEVGVYTEMDDADRAWFVGDGVIGEGKTMAEIRTDEHHLIVKDNALVFDREVKTPVGVTASLEEGEELEKRITAARMLAVGWYALTMPKKTGGTKYLVIDGPDFFWSMEVAQSQIQESMGAVSVVNNLSKRLTPKAAPVAPAAASASEGEHFVDRLERLAKLHENGALTDEEFTAAKMKLIAM